MSLVEKNMGPDCKTASTVNLELKMKNLNSNLPLQILENLISIMNVLSLLPWNKRKRDFKSSLSSPLLEFFFSSTGLRSPCLQVLNLYFVRCRCFVCVRQNFLVLACSFLGDREFLKLMKVLFQRHLQNLI